MAEKPSGCVVWIFVDDALNLKAFRWFRGREARPLPNIADMKVLKHTKGNARGTKSERQGHRVIRQSNFDIINGMDDLLRRLLGNAILN
ncbi:hypothetical protein [Rhizobium sp. Root1220]|uniref:hypothetical protein n=1 Tax=Rhizobium sp. Root1220 TaxID=1736432 RepID=UPI000AACF661|nr:hypothetical protein [Rhizobium sp. Root1220]